MQQVRCFLSIVILLLGFCLFQLRVQTDPLIDSLKNLLANPKSDSLEGWYNNSLLKFYAPINQDSAILHGERAKAIAIKTDASRLMASYLLNYGSVYWFFVE